MVAEGDASPLQDERRVGLAVAGVVHVDGVAGVGGELAQGTLAAAHALGQAAAAARATQRERAVVGVAHHQRVGAGDVARGRRDVSYRSEIRTDMRTPPLRARSFRSLRLARRRYRY